MSDDQYCLKWSNHQSTILTNLMEKEQLADCILFTEGRLMKAHQVVISACSPYFEKLLNESRVSPGGMPILIFSDIKYDELSAMKEYMYRGEVNINQDNLDSFLKAANSLQIRGLSDGEPCDTGSGDDGNGDKQKIVEEPAPEPCRRRKRKDSAGSDITHEGHPSKAQKIQELLPPVEEPYNPNIVVKTEPEEDPDPPVKVEEPQIIQQEPPETPEVTTKSEPLDHSEPEVLDLTGLDDSDCEDFEMPGPSQSDLSQENDLTDEIGGDIFSNDSELMQELLNTRDRILLRRKLSACINDQDRIMHPNNEKQTEMQMVNTSGLTSVSREPDQSSSHFRELRSSITENSLTTEQSPASLSQTSHTNTPNPVTLGDNNHVLSVLKSSLDGRAILRQGERGGGKLEGSSRRMLARLLIKNELESQPDRNISRAEFIRWSQEIVALFPGESPFIYYTSYLAANSFQNKINASGKLYEAYISRRRTLRKRGYLPPTNRKQTKQIGPPIIATSEILSLTNPVSSSTSEEDCRKLRWLETSVEPWHTVENNWQATISARLSVLQRSTTIADYFAAYPALSTSNGYLLLMKDFNRLFKVSDDCLLTGLSQLRDGIIREVMKKADNSREIASLMDPYMALITEREDSDTKNNVALISLPFLVPLLTSKKYSKSAWRPSRTEVRDGFITQVTSEELVMETVNERKDKLRGHGVTFQPLVIAVGSSLSSVTSAYVVVNDVFYKFRRLVTAVDVAFKVFHSTPSKYPEESEQVWLLLQRAFYNIKTEQDRVSQGSRCVLSDLGIIVE